MNNFTLENCYNTGNVTGGTSASFVGGIVGNNYIDNRNSGYTFRNCYNTGTVTGKSSFGAVYGSDTYKDAQNATTSLKQKCQKATVFPAKPPTSSPAAK